MLVGKVIGTATSTVKHRSMKSQKLLVIQPLMADRKQADGGPLVAIDAVGAGIGDEVMMTSDGRFARDRLQTKATPVRWTVIGIEDQRNV